MRFRSRRLCGAKRMQTRKGFRGKVVSIAPLPVAEEGAMRFRSRRLCGAMRMQTRKGFRGKVVSIAPLPVAEEGAAKLLCMVFRYAILCTVVFDGFFLYGGCQE